MSAESGSDASSENRSAPKGPALAASLAPALLRACDSRLTDIEWFRSSWQSGGAATGYARYRTDGSADVPVVVKLPVGPDEFRWTTAADPSIPGPTPRVLAAGKSLNGYDLAWLVVERFTGPPISQSLDKNTVRELLETLADWYILADSVRPVSATPQKADWDNLLSKSRAAVKDSNLDNAQHWNQVIHDVQRILPELVSTWRTRPVHTWCHGDIHPGNVMRREADGRCVLIDLGLVHPGHWVEDAVYLERQFWGREERLEGSKPVKILSKALRDRGLHFDEDHAHLANVRRVLTAACVPAFAAREWNAPYANAALALLERLLPVVGR